MEKDDFHAEGPRPEVACSNEEVDNFIAGRKKTGRKTGYKMPGWSKALLASRRSSIALEAVNAVLNEIGNILSEIPSEESCFLVSTATGCVRRLSMVGMNARQSPNARNFLFEDVSGVFRFKVNYTTSEIYNGLVTGVFMPVSADTRDRLYTTLVNSPEVCGNIKDRAMESRRRGSRMLARMDEGDDDFFSLRMSDEVDSELLAALDRASAEREL